MNRREFIRTGISVSLMAGTGLIASPAHRMGWASKVYAIGEKKSKRPNILWIMMDDSRADAVGCYGKPWARTPNTDRIASQGVRFASAIVQNPVCVACSW